jgi:hypothetical protein
MAAISLSGSGEGPGRVTGRGYSYSIQGWRGTVAIGIDRGGALCADRDLRLVRDRRLFAIPQQRHHLLNGLRRDFRCLHRRRRHRRNDRRVPVAVGGGNHGANLPRTDPGIACCQRAENG